MDDCINKECGWYSTKYTLNCGDLHGGPLRCRVYLKAEKEPVATVLCSDRVMRPLGFYEVKKRGKWTRAEWTEHGWKVLWSNWYHDDNDLDDIRAEEAGA